MTPLTHRQQILPVEEALLIPTMSTDMMDDLRQPGAPVSAVLALAEWLLEQDQPAQPLPALRAIQQHPRPRLHALAVRFPAIAVHGARTEMAAAGTTTG